MPRPESAMKSEKSLTASDASALAAILARIVKRQPGTVEGPIGALDRGNVFCREAAALEPFAVDAMRRGGIPGYGHIRRQILGQHRTDPAKRVGTDPSELMHTRESAEDGPVADLHMAGQGRVIGEDRVIANHAVMGHCT